MSKAEDALKQEEERVKNYLTEKSKNRLLNAVEEQILVKYGTQVLEKDDSGCAALLKDDKVRIFIPQNVVHSSPTGHIEFHRNSKRDDQAQMPTPQTLATLRKLN